MWGLLAISWADPGLFLMAAAWICALVLAMFLLEVLAQGSKKEPNLQHAIPNRQIVQDEVNASLWKMLLLHLINNK